MPDQQDYAGLSQLLSSNIKETLSQWLPGGSIQGNEYICGSVAGGSGKSCRINLKTGMWADFATGEKGGDLISLYAAIKNIKQTESYSELSKAYNYKTNNTEISPVFVAPPDGEPVPSMNHYKHGRPTAYWTYHDELARPLFYIARYDTPKGKMFAPWTYDGTKFRSKAWPGMRPLYNHHKISQFPNKPVLVCEGEKAADAAEIITRGNYVCTTWPNGSKSYNKAKWDFLRDRKILIWPDADKPGKEAADEIAKKLVTIANEVKILNVDGQVEGWDADDALKSGYSWDNFYEWAKPRAQTININISDDGGIITGSMLQLWDDIGIPKTASGMPIINTECVVKILNGVKDYKDLVWFDEFHEKIFTKWRTGVLREWSSVDELNLCLEIQEKLAVKKMTEKVVKNAIIIMAHRDIRNEVRDWFDTLVWDKKPRIKNFFVDYFGAKSSDYVNCASKNWWVSMAARVYNPGCIMQNMVILKSGQGKFKSTALDIIAGQWYFSASDNIGSKDFLLSLHGKILVEIAELSAFTKADINTIKRVVSDRKDRFRPPYGEKTKDFHRRCVFVGTTNEDQPLKDHTGGRRFWPIDINIVNIPALKRDREQLFAEAIVCFKNGDKWHEMPEHETKMIQEQNRQYDEWEDVILQYIKRQNIDEIKIPELWEKCFKDNNSKCDKATQMRIARCLISIGFERHLVRLNGEIIRSWKKSQENDIEEF